MSWYDFLIDKEWLAARREKTRKAEFMRGFDYGASCVLATLDEGLDSLRKLVEDGGQFDREITGDGEFDLGVRQAHRIGCRILDHELERLTLKRNKCNSR